MKKRTAAITALTALLLFSCNKENDFYDVTTKVISPDLSPESDSKAAETSPEGYKPFGEHYYKKDGWVYNKRLEFVCTEIKTYQAPGGDSTDHSVTADGDLLYYDFGELTQYIIPQKSYTSLPKDSELLVKHDAYGTAYLSDGMLYLDFSEASAIIDEHDDLACIDLSKLVSGDFKCTSAAFSYPYNISMLLETNEGLKHFAVSNVIITGSGQMFFESRLQDVNLKDNFFGSYIYTPVPHITRVLDLDGNIKEFFPGWDAKIKGEMLILTEGEIVYDYMAYTKDLEPVIIEGDDPEYATRFERITMCPDGSFIAKTDSGNTLYHYASDGSLIKATEFDRLFSSGMEMPGVEPVAAALQNGHFLFVTPDGNTVAELPFDESLAFFADHHSREQGTEDWYYRVSFTKGDDRFDNSVHYYISEDGTDFGVTGLDDAVKNIIYRDGAMCAYYDKGKIAVTLPQSDETLYYDDLFFGVYYDSLFGKAKDQPVFVREQDGLYTLSVYKYGSMSNSPRGKDFITFGNYIIIDNALYDYNLNGLYNFYDQYSGGIDISEYSADSDGNLTVSGMASTGEPVTYRFYTTLETAKLPEDAKLIAECTDSLGVQTLHRHGDGIYHTDSESRLTVKLPFETNDVVCSSVYPLSAIFARSADGKLYGSAFEYCYIRANGLGKAPALFMTVDFAPDKQKTARFGDAELVSLAGTYHMMKNGEYAGKLDFDFGYEIIGDFLYADDGPVGYAGVVYNTDLEPIYDGILNSFTHLPDGRYIAYTDDSALLFDENGTLIYESENGRICLLVGDSFMLMRDTDNVIRLYSPDMELLCEFPGWGEDYSFHTMLSGRKNADGVVGYYFVTENTNDTKDYFEGAVHGQYGSHIFEFYYIPETGESGVIDNGYGEFAYAKPVLYLYPTEETEVTVTFEHPEQLTTVYPAYGNSWRVTAAPDGTLTDAKGREYYCLYWEEDSETALYSFTDGFCVAGEASAEFLEEKLAYMGFTDKEANEFIIYWLPILERSEYNLIRFELTEEREASNAIHITPNPDSMLRIAMHIKPLDSSADIREQVLPTFKRIGFAAVEWGGCVH